MEDQTGRPGQLRLIGVPLLHIKLKGMKAEKPTLDLIRAKAILLNSPQEVVVISGKYKDYRGTVLQIDKMRNGVAVSGVKEQKLVRHEDGTVTRIPGLIHVSNVMLIDQSMNVGTRVALRVDNHGNVGGSYYLPDTTVVIEAVASDLLCKNAHLSTGREVFITHKKLQTINRNLPGVVMRFVVRISKKSGLVIPWPANEMIKYGDNRKSREVLKSKDEREADLKKEQNDSEEADGPKDTPVDVALERTYDYRQDVSTMRAMRQMMTKYNRELR